MNESSMIDIVERIKSRRQVLNLSFQDLANLTGMSKSTLQRYESGAIKNIPLSKVEILASALQTTPEYLMGWEEISTKDNRDITFDDFTYALHAETQDLTEENKQKLLEMARLFKLSQEHKDK